MTEREKNTAQPLPKLGGRLWYDGIDTNMFPEYAATPAATQDTPDGVKSDGGGKWTLRTAAVLAVMLLPVTTSAQEATAFGPTTFFKAEYNATAKDLGVQWFWDADSWRTVELRDPNGVLIYKSTASGSIITNGGAVENFNEATEPALTEVSFAQFQQRFPAGSYKFKGFTPDGVVFTTSDTFTHVIPAGATITAPAEGAVVPDADLTVRWNPVTTRAFGSGSITITGYRIIIERESPNRHYEVEVGPSTEKVLVPHEFFQPGVDYKLEVLAIESTGNQTLVEREFSTQ